MKITAQLRRQVLKFRDDAIADGWTCTERYEGESIDSYYQLDKDGFLIAGCNRSYEVKICGWGPDGLDIKTPSTYSMQAIQDAVHRCSFCGAEGVETVRVGFADRSCKECQRQEETRFVRTTGYS